MIDIFKNYCFYRVESSDDFLDYLAIKSSPEQVLWSGFDSPPNPISFKEYFEKRFLESTSDFLFFLIEKKTSQVVGYSQLKRHKKNNFEQMGMGIYEKFQGKKLGFFLDYLTANEALNISGCKKITIFTYVSELNIPSIKAFIKAGYLKTNCSEERFLKGFNKKHLFIKLEKECTK